MKTRLAIFFLLSLYLNISGQLPVSDRLKFSYVKNYSATSIDEHPQNWSIVQSDDGIMFFGNTGGVLKYDGVSWNKITVPNNLVRSLALHGSNIIIGGKNEFGLLVPDSLQRFVYRSYNNLLDTKDKRFSVIYNTHSINGKAYFVSTRIIIVLDNGKVKSFHPQNRFSGSFSLHDTLYVADSNVGVKKTIENKLVPAPELDVLLYYDVTSALKLREHTTLLTTYRNGIFVLDKSGLNKLVTDVDDYLSEKLIYSATLLSDNNIAVATRFGGLVIIDDKGNLISYLNDTNGLQDNTVRKVYEDKQSNLWLALNNGITMVEYKSPFTFYDRRSNLSGITLSLAKHKNELYVGTTDGLFKLVNNNKTTWSGSQSFSRLSSINDGVWSLYSLDNELLIGTENGLFVLNKKVTQISTTRIYCMAINETNNSFYLGTDAGLKRLFKSAGKWIIRDIPGTEQDNIHTINIDGSSLWLGTLSKGVIRLSDSALNNVKKKSIERYDSSHGLPLGEINVYSLDGRVVFATPKGLFKYNEDNNSFSPDSILGPMFADGSRGVFRLVEDSDSNIWFHSENINYHAIKSDSTYKIDTRLFKRLHEEQVNVIYPDGNNIWFGANERIIKFNRTIKKNNNFDFNALIRNIYVNTDSLIYGGAPDPSSSEMISLSFRDRNLRFQYAAAFYEAAERTEYQYKLDGYEINYSKWTKETTKDYTNLSEGNYTFFVRAKNVYGDISTEAAFGFKILPPYYRTVWAYIVYALMLISFGYVVVKWRINKLEKEKENLTRLVDEQTSEIKEQTEKLKELDKIKSRFFANISHEFRTPLTLIIGPTEQMLIDEQSKDKRRSHSLILRNSKKLLGLINKLLDLSKIQSGNMKLNLTRIDMVRFTREVTALFESLAEQKKIQLSFASDQEEIPFVCDTDKIEKVLVNLLSNAIKFTGESGNVSVQIHNTDLVNIEVTDSGIGISESELKHVFDPFYQADSSSNRKFGGTGIGLSLAKEFVELHGGSVNVKNNSGSGTTFTVRLPDNLMVESEIEPVHPENSDYDIEYEVYQDHNNSTEDSGTINQSEDRNTILVVEDNDDARNYIMENLRNDFNIVEARNGLEGFEHAKEIVPDLIISDVMMPGTDGFEFCRNVKSTISTSHIPVILLTAKAGDESILLGLETGADDYITKPFNVQILQTRVKNLIDLRAQLQQTYKRDALLQPSEIKVSSLDDKFLKQLHDLIEKNIANPDLDIEMFCDEFLMSRTSLFRKIKALTGETPKQFLRTYRLKRAAQLLKQGSGNVTEVAFDVGFNDSGYFTRCFKKEFNQLPSDFQQKEST